MNVSLSLSSNVVPNGPAKNRRISKDSDCSSISLISLGINMVGYIKSIPKSESNPFHDERLLSIPSDDLSEFFIENFFQDIIYCFEYLDFYLNLRVTKRKKYNEYLANKEYAFLLAGVSYDDFRNDSTKRELLVNRFKELRVRKLEIVCTILKLCKDNRRIDPIYLSMAEWVARKCFYTQPNDNSYKVPVNNLCRYVGWE